MKANKASRTAQYMALFRAIETYRPSNVRLFADPYAILFLDRGLWWAAKTSAIPFLGQIIYQVIQRRGPGSLSSGVARTKYIDDLLHRTILDGVQQVIILGAGFDTRALRLGFLQKIPIIEIDHPDTAKVKINILKKELGELPSNICWIQIDFNHQSLDDLTQDQELHFDKPTVVILEGVTNYLNKESIDRTFKFVKKFPSNSYLIFTYIDRLVLDCPNAFIGTEKIFRNLTKNEECWTFGFTPEKLPEYLAQFQLNLLEDLGAKEYRKKYMPNRKTKGYEFYRVAFVGDCKSGG